MPEYVSREAIIDEIMSLKSRFGAMDNWDRGYDKAIAEVLEHIERVPVTDIQPVNQWISVKDRLPDIEEGTVLVWIDDGIADDIRICDCLHIAYWYGDEKIFCDLKDSVIKGITHWMYTSALPEPPKGGDTND